VLAVEENFVYGLAGFNLLSVELLKFDLSRNYPSEMILKGGYNS